MGVIEEFLDELSAVGIMVAAVVVALVAHAVIYAVVARVARRTESGLDESVLHHTRNPMRLLASVGALLIVLPFLGLSDDIRGALRQAYLFVGILGLGWLVVGLTRVGLDAIVARYPTDITENIDARTILTQMRFLQRLGAIVIWVLTAGLALLTIPGVQPLAASLLASAGVLGIVLGIAAGPVIGNLFAGIQIALTQPIRLDDIVKIGDTAGRVTSITYTFIILSIWDGRQLVVPLSKVTDGTLENWTREARNLVGTVYISVDYRTPIEALRTELKRTLDESELWNGEAWGLQVTDAEGSTVKVRATMSAPDAGTAWNLRCHVRENLVSYLQREHPDALPVVRRIEQRTDAAQPAG